jgi:hypothetical protein
MEEESVFDWEGTIAFLASGSLVEVEETIPESEPIVEDWVSLGDVL